MPTKAPVSTLPPVEPLEPRVGRAVRPPATGLLTLGVLGVAFCALPGLAWAVSGHWVPEVMAFGLAMGLVGIVSQTR